MQSYSFETLKVDTRGQIIQRCILTAEQYVEDLGEEIALEMVAIPGGSFWMGSIAGEGYEDERPRHIVYLSPFLVGKFLVTQAQWQRVMGKLPPCRSKGTNLPVDRISWDDAIVFCRRLTKMTKKGYRLPTEAEWEYACRAGTSSPFCFGPTITTDLANYVGEHIYKEESKGVYRHQSNEMGIFPPNEFGVYDMHGNLWEWCADAWHDDYHGAPVDGAAWEARNTKYRVLRGGSWHEIPANCRSAVRLKMLPIEKDDCFGLRVALSELG